jgi:high mobility group protein B1
MKDAEEKEKKSKGNGPKKPLTAYFLFLADVREKITSQGFKGKEVGTEAGRLWKAASDSEKGKYEELNKKDKVRYEKELKEFNEKGFFIDSNGEKIVKEKDKDNKENKKNAANKKDTKDTKKPAAKKNDKKKKKDTESEDASDDD